MSRTKRPHPISAQRAFTLIELLVVVAIIAVLIAILLPSLGRARDKAKASACLANLKSMSLAYVMYCNDANNGHTSVEDTKIAGCIWMYQMQDYLGNNNVHGLGQGATTNGNVFICPAANIANPNGNTINGGGGSKFWGTVNAPWDGIFDGTGVWDKAISPSGITGAPNANNPQGLMGFDNNVITSPPASTAIGYRSSYGLNSWMDVRYPFGNRGQKGVGVSVGFMGLNPLSTASSTFPPNYNDMRVLSNINPPATTPLFSDMVWVNNDKQTNPSKCFGVVPSDYGPGASSGATAPADLSGDTSSALGRAFLDRHTKAINVGFLGGNASTVKLTDLTQLDWYTGATHTTLAGNWMNIVNR